MAAAKSLAKELIRSRKAKDRMHTSKAQLNSVGMQLKQQVGKHIHHIEGMTDN